MGGAWPCGLNYPNLIVFFSPNNLFPLRPKTSQALKIKGQAVSHLRSFHTLLRQEGDLQSLVCPKRFVPERGSTPAAATCFPDL